jgi:hypothetical protein
LVQLVKVEPLLPTPWRTRAVPFGYDAAQTAKAPPFALQVTVPVPVPPVVEMVSVAGGGAAGNVAVTMVSAFIITTHMSVPEQSPPLHPVNPVPVAVNVTTAFV